MKYQLQTKNYNKELIETALFDLLKDRGISKPQDWLFTQDQFENSPWLFDEMIKAVEILRETIKKRGSRIGVVVDSDLDGYTSGAIILTLLSQIAYGEQEIITILHPGKEHGIVLDELDNDLDLLIIMDAGTNDREQHMALLKQGTKIICGDHHPIQTECDYKEYISNIALFNSTEENYPNHSLSGAGVALKFVQAYCNKYGIQFQNKLYALAACGIVADVMDISELENKYIVDMGLKYIKENQFLYGLIKDSRYNDENPIPTIKDIGWVIGPNINSIIRLGTLEQKKTILKALIFPNITILSTKRGEENIEIPLFEEAIRFCKNTKSRQRTAVDKSVGIIENELNIKDTDRAIVYVDKDKKLTFELSGLIANSLLSKYNRPIILLRNYEDNELRGSARAKCVDGMSSFKDLITGITGVNDALGHSSAFGVHIDKNLFEEFKLHLQESLQKIDFNVNLYLIDLIAKSSNVNTDIAKIMARDDIWCHGVEKPMCLITDISSNKYEIMGANNQHLKIDCGKFDAIIWNTPELTNELIHDRKFNLDAVGEFEVDKTYNVGRLQFIIKEYDKKPFVAPNIYDWVF